MEEGNKKILSPLLVSLRSLEKKVDELMREFRLRQVTDPQYVILDNAVFTQMFKISGRTAQNWRDEGLIAFSQVKGKIYYKLTDVKSFLEKHSRK